MIKSQFVSTAIYSDESDDYKELTLKLQCSQKHASRLLMNDRDSDIRFYIQDRVVPAHSWIIYKHCAFLTHTIDGISKDKGNIYITEEINFQIFKIVLACIYGEEIKIKRTIILEVYKISRLLQIKEIMVFLESDMVENFQEYELFELMQASSEMNLGNIYELCVNELQGENFQQLRYCKFHLLGCNEDTFKEVIRLHNERKEEDATYGHKDKYIQELINEYCRHNKMGDKKRSELIDELTENSEYNFTKDIYARTKKSVTPLRYKTQSNNQFSVVLNQPRSANTFQSMIDTRQNHENTSKNVSSFSMIGNYTHGSQGKKRRSSKGSENQMQNYSLTTQIINKIKESESIITNNFELASSRVGILQQNMQEDISKAKDNYTKLKELEMLMNQIEEEMKINQKKLGKIAETVSKIESNPDDYDLEQEGTAKQKKLGMSLTESRWIVC